MTKQLTYTEIKNIAEQWTEEASQSVYDIWYHPYKAEGQSEMTVLAVLWSLHTERQMSVEGMYLHFQRFVDAVKTRQEAEKLVVAKTQKTDNRTLAQVAKSVATMRRKVATAVRKHNSLKARLSRLAEANRIVWLHKDAEIVAGVYNVWYVKADSLNPDKDTEWNWYYQVIFVEEHSVYQCSCEDQRQCDCKHAVALGASFEEAAKRERYNMAFDPCLVA